MDIMLSVFYDGYDLSEYMTIRKVLPYILPEVNNAFTGLPHLSTRYPLYSTYGQAVVEIEATIKRDINHNRDKLAGILAVREEKKLVIGDQRDRYLMCRIDGSSNLSSRFFAGTVTLKFISQDSFWRSNQGYEQRSFDQYGFVPAENKGNAPTPPIIDIQFTGDCGHISVVSPNHFISLGNKARQNITPVPATEFAITSALTSFSGWTRQTNAQNWIPDYKKISSAGTGRIADGGFSINPSTLGTGDQWHGHAYTRNFSVGAAGEMQADNFVLDTELGIFDLSGYSNRTIATLIVVMTADNKPIMTTSIYDVGSARDELTVTFKVPETRSGREKFSRIIHTGRMKQLNGYVQMKKNNDTFSWEVYNKASNSSSTETKTLKVGDIVHLTSDARTIYDWNGRALNLDRRIIGEALRVTQVRNSPKGRYRLSNVRGGYVEGFFEPDAIKETTVTRQSIVAPQTIRHSIRDGNLAQLRAAKVFIWQAKWGNTTPYSQHSLKRLTVKRNNGTVAIPPPNTFMAGDRIVIDNEQGRILYNGKQFEGTVDVASRFFTIDGGVTELALLPEAGASMPNAQVKVESRWF